MRVLFSYMILIAMTFMVINPMYFYRPTSSMAELTEEEHQQKNSGKEVKIFPYISADIKSKAIGVFNTLQKNRFAQYVHVPIDEDHSMAVYLPPDQA